MILKKPFCLLIIFALFTGGLLFAETVSVVIVETGIPEDAPVIESSRNWENGLMDTFFENGHIVSNAAMLRLNPEQAKPYPSEQLFNIEEVREGGSAYYVLAVLNYTGLNEDNSIPSLISLRLVQVFSDEVLYEVQIDGTEISVQDELEHAKRAAEAMIPYVKNK
jgi:hypothetical protein